MAANLGFNDIVTNAAKLYIDGVAAGTIGLPTLVATGAVLASAGTSTPPTWARELVLSSGTKTVSTPVLDLTQTWNSAGGTFTGIKFNVTDTASANGTFIDFQLNGSTKFNISKSGTLSLTGGVNLNSNDIFNARFVKFTAGSFLTEASNGVIGLYDGSASNFNRLQFGGTTSAYPALSRGGTQLNCRLADDSGYAGFRSLYTKYVNGSVIGDAGDGVITLQNAAGTSFSRLQFGGTTNSFAALKNNGNEISVVYADDSSSAGISVRYVRTTFAFTAAGLPSGLRGMRAVVVDSNVAAAGNFGNVVVGGGANEVPVWYDATAAAWKIG